MKKAITITAILSIIAGIITLALSLIKKAAPKHSIIGGADGPTVIFLATHIGSGSLLIGLIAGSILLITGILLLVLFGKKKD